MDWNRIMSDANFGEVVRPSHCQVSVSADKSQLALTFRSEQQAPTTLILPLLGAAGLQQKLAQSLYQLGVRPIPARSEIAAEVPAD
jgi:hypothetical protein